MRFHSLGALLVVAVGIAVSAGTADASVVLRLTDEALTEQAELIVRGRVVAAKCRRDDVMRMIVTDYTIRVDERMKGSPPDIVTVTEMGGRLGEERHIVPGAPSYRVGETIVAFLYTHRDRLRTVGMAQGLFFVRALPGAGEEVLVRDLADTTLAVPDPDGIIRPHPELTRVTEPPRRLEELRRLLQVAVPSDRIARPGR